MAAFIDNSQARYWLLECFRAGLSTVDGKHCVAQEMRNFQADRIRLIAIGKAAGAMVAGAWQAAEQRIVDALVISKAGHLDVLPDDQRITAIEAGHPLPDQASLTAGEHLLTRLRSGKPGDRWLILLSGGASSLVEVLPDGYTLTQLQRLNDWLLGSGMDICRMNAIRQRVSCIKGGKLNDLVQGQAEVWAISDVPDDDPAVIGSGLFYRATALADDIELPDWVRDWMKATATETSEQVVHSTPHRILANLDRMLDAMARFAAESDIPVRREPNHFSGDAQQLGHTMAETLLQGPPGLTIWGGEATVRLPQVHGRGGRSQQLALAAACRLAGHDDCLLLAVGSDGTDGPTDAAGALVDGGTLSRAAAEGFDAGMALAGADAYPCLAESGDLIVTGPTGTNVTDVVLGLKLG